MRRFRDPSGALLLLAALAIPASASPAVSLPVTIVAVIPSAYPAGGTCTSTIRVEWTGSSSPLTLEMQRDGQGDPAITVSGQLSVSPAVVEVAIAKNAQPGPRDVVLEQNGTVVGLLAGGFEVLPARPPAGPFTGPFVWAGSPSRSLYEDILYTDDNARRAVQDMKTAGFKGVFLHVFSTQFFRSAPYASALEAFLREAHTVSPRLEVHAYCYDYQGESTSADPTGIPKAGLAAVAMVEAWNSGHPADAQFDGVNLDIEPRGPQQTEAGWRTLELLSALDQNRTTLVGGMKIGITAGPSRSTDPRGSFGVDYCDWSQLADLFVPQAYVSSGGLRGLPNASCTDKTPQFAPCVTDASIRELYQSAVDPLGPDVGKRPDTGAQSFLGLSSVDRLFVFRPSGSPPLPGANPRYVGSEYWGSAVQGISCSLPPNPDGTSPCEENWTLDDLNIYLGPSSPPQGTRYPASDVTVYRWKVGGAVYGMPIYVGSATISLDLQQGDIVFVLRSDLPSRTALAADLKYAVWHFERTRQGMALTSVSLASGRPASLDVPPQASPSIFRAILSFSFPSSDTCTMGVEAQAEDGTVLASRTVPASGTQLVDMGILPAAGWHLVFVSTCNVDVTGTLQIVPDETPGPTATDRFVPIALDVTTSSAHYTTELTLTNSGATLTTATLSYVPSLGKQQGGGQTHLSIGSGQQIVIPDAIGYLRGSGLAIPSSSSDPSQGGTLRVSFDGTSDAGAVAVTARTTTATSTPQPVGAAGLAYTGLLPGTAVSSGSLVVYALRSDAQDRSNLAVYNTSPDPVTVRVVAFSGDGTGASRLIADGVTIPAYGWVQYSRVLDNTGIASGWITVENTGGTGSFFAYGVINDNVTNDGSFVPPTVTGVSGSRLTVPVLVETPTFISELVLANRGAGPAGFTLRYVESISPALGPGGAATVQLKPHEQLVIPGAIEYLRRLGLRIGTAGAATYAGALQISVSGANLSDVFAGARTAAQSPAGGQYGVFTPCIYQGQEAADEATVYGLRADASNRSNVAVLNAAADGGGDVTLELHTFDGDFGGIERGAPHVVSLSPGQFEQLNGLLAAAGIQNGWVRARRIAGSAPWISYGVINDGANPGERTGDGAYVPMVVTGAAAAAAPSVR